MHRTRRWAAARASVPSHRRRSPGTGGGGWPPRIGVLVERRYFGQAQPVGLVAALRALGHEVVVIVGDNSSGLRLVHGPAAAVGAAGEPVPVTRELQADGRLAAHIAARGLVEVER